MDAHAYVLFFIGFLTLAFLTLVALLIYRQISGFDNKFYFKRNDRYYPMGKVPGSYLGLTKAEQDGLLINFINDNKYKM